MKRTIATALIAVATLGTATGAIAAPSQAQLNDIARYAPKADLTELSTREVNVLLSAIHSGDSENQKRLFVQSYING
ncbi:hypothetical protein [Citreimonas sp.]|uniref:hypothetical protein n=1 Tax=Citreimonas sp. TaxID=3036715 RepID=UPI0035C7DB23